MRDFSWKYFTVTGDVDAYILYKQVTKQPGYLLEAEQSVEDEMEPQAAESKLPE